MTQSLGEELDPTRPAPIDPEQDVVLHAMRHADGIDSVETYGALVGGPVERDDPLRGRFVVREGLLGAVEGARRTGEFLDRSAAGARAQMWTCLESDGEGEGGADLVRALSTSLTPTMPPRGRRRRVVLQAGPTTALAHLPLEAVEIDRSAIFETGRAELLRYVNVPGAPPAVPHPPYLRRHRALVLVGDVDQDPRDSGSVQDLRNEVQDVIDALRHAGADVLVGSVTGRLDLSGAIQRPLLLDERGGDDEREERLRLALGEMLSAVPIDVLHYIGHAEETTDTPVGPASERISFSLPMRPHDRGGPKRVWVHGAEIDRWIRQPIRLCTVSACAAAPQLAAALCAAAEHVVVMACPVTPEFTATWTRELYGRLFDDERRRPIGEAVCQAREALRSSRFAERAWVPRHYARTLDDAPFSKCDFRTYLDAMVSEIGVLEGAMSAWWLPKDEAWLDRVYVDVGLEGIAPHNNASLETADDSSVSSEDPWTLDRLVETSPHRLGLARAHFRLIGPAGSGKTTALKAVARTLASRGDRLPVYVKLPRWERHEFSVEYLENQGIDAKLMSDRAADLVMLLDGLDEVRRIERFRELLRQRWFPRANATLVVAGRSSAEGIGAGFCSVELRPLTPRLAFQLAARVLNIERGIAERDARSSRDPRRRALAKARTERIGNHVDSAEALVEHLRVHLPREAEVPLFVTLAAHLWSAGHEVTAEGRLSFYEQVLDMLVNRKHRSDGASDRPTSALRSSARALAIESIAQADVLEREPTGTFGEVLSEWNLAVRAIPSGRFSKIEKWEWPEVRGALLETGLLVSDPFGDLEWTHPSFREALVAESLVDVARRDGLRESISLAESLIEKRDDIASAYAEAFALFSLGLPTDEQRERWIRFLFDRESDHDLGGRLAGRLLWLGVPVSDELAAEVLGATGDWEARFRLFEALDDSDADAFVAYLGAVVRHAHDVGESGKSVRTADLAYAWYRADQLEREGRGLEVIAGLRRLVLERLPRPKREQLHAAFETIGGAWANTDEERESCAADRSRLAPLRADPDHPLDAAPLDASFWVHVKGTPAGASFDIGARPDDEGAFANEAPPSEGVHLSSFAISAVPVTRGLYRLFDPAYGQNTDCRVDEPATHIAWYEARLFGAWATYWLHKFDLLGHGEAIDLPTEAQWEYAARERGLWTGGGRFQASGSKADLTRTGWFSGSTYGLNRPRTMPVGLLTPATIDGPDEKGPSLLWDLHGNVWEWCRNAYTDRLEGGVDPVGPELQVGQRAGRVLRGGSFFFDARDCRATYRGWGDPALGDAVDRGFRLVRIRSGGSSTFEA
ncbi:MAG: SUMF1/EgtB/PvdO family nonheme iron enzyme [Planctomycetota bacterium]